MTPHNTPLPQLGDPARRRNALAAFCVFVIALLALSACGVGGDRVDAGVPTSDAESVAESSDCADWANEIVAARPVDGGGDVESLRSDYRDRADLLGEVAAELPSAEADVIQAYADAVSDFAADPMAPGASRRMGETAADAARIASRSC